MIGTRRSFLAAAGVLPVALVASRAFGADQVACYDPSALPLSQRSRRRALSYVDASPDPHKQCSRCSFFSTKPPSCGTCVMLSGGPVNAGGLCNSFAPKAAK